MDWPQGSCAPVCVFARMLGLVTAFEQRVRFTTLNSACGALNSACDLTFKAVATISSIASPHRPRDRMALAGAEQGEGLTRWGGYKERGDGGRC